MYYKYYLFYYVNVAKACKFPSEFADELAVLLNTQVRKKLSPKELSHHA